MSMDLFVFKWSANENEQEKVRDLQRLQIWRIHDWNDNAV